MSNDKKLHHIKGLLAELFNRKDWQKRIDMHQIFQSWDRAVGKEIAKHAQPAVIRGNVLWVDVTDSVWMQQLHMQKMLLLERINRKLTEKGFTDIRFQISAGLARPGKEQTYQPQAIAPNKERLVAFDDMVSGLEDAELKQAMRKLWIKVEGSGRK